MKKLRDLVIHRNDARYSTFPSLTRAADGRILCGFRQAPLEPSGHSHLHSQSRAVFVTSDDDGDTWSAEPRAICPQDELGQQDPQLMTTASGRMIASFFRWQAHAPSELQDVDDLYLHKNSKGCNWSNAGVACCHSDDHGATWSDLRRLPFPYGRRGGASRAPAVELPSGRLLLPAYSPQPGTPYSTAYLVASDDGGITWRFHAVMADPADLPEPDNFHEPHVARTADGRLHCFIRCYGEGGLMRHTFSDDDGTTWSPCVETRVWGFPQASCLLPDGRLFLVYGHRREPLGVRARLLAPDLSDLDTAPELAIREDGVTRDLGYPTAILRQDGTILLAYYIHGEDAVRHIAGAVIDPD